MDWFGFATSETKTRLIALAAAYGLFKRQGSEQSYFRWPWPMQPLGQGPLTGASMRWGGWTPIRRKPFRFARPLISVAAASDCVSRPWPAIPAFVLARHHRAKPWPV